MTTNRAMTVHDGKEEDYLVKTMDTDSGIVSAETVSENVEEQENYSLEDELEPVYGEFGEEVGEYAEKVAEEFLEEDEKLDSVKTIQGNENSYVVLESLEGSMVYRRKIPVFKKWIYEGIKDKPWSFSEAGTVEEAYDIENEEMRYSDKRV